MDAKFSLLSALTGGRSSQSSGSSLNKQLSSTLRSGREVFSEPFGAKTKYKTKSGGQIIVMFTFDPDTSYNSSYHIASMQQDFVDSLRKEIYAFLIPDVYKPPKVSEKALCWGHFRKTIPTKVLAGYFERHPASFADYTKWIESEVEQQVLEEKAIADALHQKTFSFVFNLAIDAYPSERDNERACSSSRKTSNPDTNNRKGVLTFYIQGVRDADENKNDTTKDAAAASSSSSSSSSASLNIPSTPSEDASAATPSSSSSSSSSSASAPKATSKSQKAFRNITRRLGLSNAILTSCPRVQCKELRTGGEFFDEIEEWFLSCLGTQKDLLAKAERTSQGRALYQ